MDDVDDVTVERLWMCVAEAGYDPEHLIPTRAEDGWFVFRADHIPERVAWRARELVGLGTPMCHACWDSPGVKDWDCAATERLTETCGGSS